MRLHFDRFTWIVVAIVLLLVVGAVLTVNLTNRSAEQPAAYMEENIPEAPVFNAMLAIQNGDVARARAELTQKVLDEYKKDPFDRIASSVSTYGGNAPSRRVRVLEVNVDESDPESGYVTIAEDYLSGGDLFGPSTWSNQRAIRVAVEEGEWKVDDLSLFN